MAKVTGPLMSMSASGSLANAITFGNNKGRNIVRVKVTPANPQTDAQIGVRASFAGLNKLYKTEPTSINAAFQEIANQKQISPFAAFTGFNQKRLSQDLAPTNIPTPTEEAPTANATGLAGVDSGKYASLSWTPSVDTDAWGLYIFRKLGSDPTGLRNELVYVATLADTTYLDGPLASGTWHYVVQAFHIEGGKTSVSAAVTVTIP